MKRMTLEIQNFGAINEAKIDINKINIIAGQNATGKTTSSKLLYCLLASVSSDGSYLADGSIKDHFNPLLQNLIGTIHKDYPEEANKLFKLSMDLTDIRPMIKRPESVVKEIYYEVIDTLQGLKFKNREFYNEELNQIKNLLEMDDNSIYVEIIKTLLKIEFDGNNQIINNFNDSIIKFHGQNNECEFENKICHKGKKIMGELSDDYLNCIKINEISYIETPYILDFMNAVDYDFIDYFSKQKPSLFHQKLLMKKLRDNSSKQNVYDEVINERIIYFQEKISKIIDGNFKFDSNSNDFQLERNGKSFTIKNTSSGLKQLGLIQLLLENRKLLPNSYLIMDEPEVHLHPEWQLKLAEIIVLLAKDLNITVYINSHSPQFIEAIEVYSENVGIKDDVNFYLSEESDNGKYDIERIDRSDLVRIYDSLGNSYDKINDIRMDNLLK